MDNMTNGTSKDPGNVGDGLGWFEYPVWRWTFFNIIIWLMPILLVFGIIVNLLCFVTILHSPKTFPKISRRSMLIITACDILVLCINGVNCFHTYWNKTVGNVIVRQLLSRQHDGAAACYVINFIYKYFLNGTPFFQVSLTFERVLAVAVPLKVKRIMTARNHIIMLVVLLIVGSADSLIWAIEQEHYDGRCQGSRNKALVAIADKLQYNIEFYVSKVGLFFFLLLGCVIVAVVLNIQTKRMARMSNNTSSSQSRTKMISTCAVMIGMNLLFILAHAPRAAISVGEGYARVWKTSFLKDGELDLAYQAAEGVMYLHSIFDPFVYLIGKGFRNAFRNTLGYLAALVVCKTRRYQEGRREATTRASAVSSV